MAIRKLESIRVLIAVGESKSLTQAGHRLGISASAVSKALSRLEKDVGARLLVRTSRHVALTDNGLRLYSRFQHIAAEIEDAESDLAISSTSLRGRLQVQMPIAFGRKVLLPALREFVRQYPHLTMNVELSDRISDLSEERIDVAVRIGEVGDARLIAKRMCTLRYVVCGSPSYLARNPAPRCPEDLSQHTCLAYINPHTGRYRDWNFCERGNQFSKTVSGPLNLNSTESLLDAAVAGVGLVAVSTFVAADAIRSGKLRIVLEQYLCPGMEVYAVCLPYLRTAPRVKALIGFLETAVPHDQLWDRILRRKGCAPQSS